MSAAPHLCLSNVGHSFGGHESVVTNVDLEMAPGKITVLMGPSGAGKSTLLRLIAGMHRVHSGTITLGRRVLSSSSHTVPIEQRRIGLIFQDFALFPHMTAFENIRFGLMRHDSDQRAAIARDWLQRLQLSDRANAYPHQLSGGEQQRVAIARALAAEPDAILLDEPFSGLDPSLREDVRARALDTIRAAQIPALMVTHDPSEALAHGDRVAIMASGRVLQVGPGAELYAEPRNLNVMQALGPAQAIDVHLMPVAWQAHLPEIDRIYARPEAFVVSQEGECEAVIERVYSNGLSQFAQVRHGEIQYVAMVERSQAPKVGDSCHIRLNLAQIHAFKDP